MTNAGTTDVLVNLASAVCVVRDVTPLARGHVRLETRFLYPDRSAVDLFIKNPLQTNGKLILTDMGYTTLWLNDLLVRPWQSKKRSRFVDDSIRVLEVHQNGGAFETEFTANSESLIDAVVRLGQACVRVADLTFTRRSSSQVYAGEEVEEIITDADLPYDANAPLIGRYGNPVTVDFLVQGRRQQSAVLTVISETPGGAHAAVNEAFGKLYDLKIPSRSEQLISVFNDRVQVYRDEDLDRLRDVSELVGISRRSELQSLLAA